MKKYLTVLLALVAMFTTQAVNAQTSPTDWKYAYQEPDGTIWSNVLPAIYANCISKKNAQGFPQLDQDGFVDCKKDAHGNYLNASRYGRDVFEAGTAVIQKSDATEACRAIGGKLPTKEDYERLGANHVKLRGMNGHFWTSSVHPDFQYHAFYFLGDLGYIYDKLLINVKTEVRCVSR